MMRSSYFAIGLALLSSSAGAGPEPVPLDSILRQQVSAAGPGCAVGVQQRNAPPLEAVYGMADLEHGIAISPSTVFDVGSVSKQFTAAAILLLAEQGKLSLSDDIRKYLPELPNYGSRITIDHLLTHTSGLRDWGSIEAATGWFRMIRVTDADDVLDMARRQRELNSRPGASYSYNSTGYTLLALIVKRASGSSLADFSHDHIFLPLGMTHTEWRDDFRRVVPLRAQAYEKSGDGYEAMVPFENAYGNGGLLTTLGDLLIWNDALQNRKLGQSVTEALQKPTTLNDGTQIGYARGLIVEKRRGITEIAHDGLSGAFTAYAGRFPDEGISIVALCNGGTNPRALAHKIADELLPHTMTSLESNGPARGLQLEEGLYADDRAGASIILLRNPDGSLRTKGGAIFSQGEDGIELANSSVRIIGRTSFQLSDREGNVITYVKRPAFAPRTAQLRRYAGTYVSPELLSTYIIEPTKSGLRYAILGRPQVGELLTPTYEDAFEDEDGRTFRFSRHGERASGFRLGDDRMWAVQFRRAR